MSPSLGPASPSPVQSAVVQAASLAGALSSRDPGHEPPWRVPVPLSSVSHRFFLGEMWAHILGAAGPCLVTEQPQFAPGLPRRASQEAGLPVTHTSSLSPPSTPARQALSGGKEISSR